MDQWTLSKKINYSLFINVKFLIILLKIDPKKEYKRILNFIGINDDVSNNIRKNSNISHESSLLLSNLDFSKKRLVKPNHLSINASLPRHMIARLSNYYLPYNKKLKLLLNINIPWI